MAILPPPNPNGEGTPPAAICPVCGSFGNSAHYLPGVPVDVPRAEYMCSDGGHLWITSWFAPQDGAA